MKSTDAPLPAGLPPGRSALPDLHGLETFVAVCEAGSMAVAAQQLGISQSAVSQAIKVLEADYGTQLFDRDVRPVRPTHAGTTLFALADALLTHARRVPEQMRHTTRQDRPQIRLGCVDSFASTVGPALIRALSGRAQQLQLWSGLTPGLNAQLVGRELDLAICTELPAVDARIGDRLLFSESWVAVFPRDAPRKTLTEARELASIAGDLPLIRYTQRSVIGQQIERFLLHVGVQAPRRFEFDATDPLLSLVSAGLGWAVSTPLCLWQSRAWLAHVQLVPIPPARLGRREFHLLCREAEWSAVAEEVAALTRSLLAHELLPALATSMPELPADAVSIFDPSTT